MTNQYFQLFETENCTSKVFDHLIWPQQIDNYLKYFDEDNFRVIVMKRDPRDVFLLNKYVWYYSPIGIRTAVPSLRTEAGDFVHDWQRTVKQGFVQPNVLQVQFEDLVYNYDESVEKIEDFLGLSSSQHTRKHERFNPQNSIENTQVYNSEVEWKQEVGKIASALSNDLYDFPYTYIPQQKLMFD